MVSAPVPLTKTVKKRNKPHKIKRSMGEENASGTTHYGFDQQQQQRQQEEGRQGEEGDEDNFVDSKLSVIDDNTRSDLQKKNKNSTKVKETLLKLLQNIFSRKDAFLLVVLLIAGFLFCGLIMLIGHLRGWYAPYHLDPHDGRFAPKPTDPNEATAHYFWKLRPSETTWYTHLVMWFLYFAHQIFHWIMIYISQSSMAEKRNGTKGPIYVSYLRWFNWVSLLGHFVFHVLHLMHSHIFYDALAQTTPIASSQGSVIMLLVFVIAIEYKDRGILFGYPVYRGEGKSYRITKWLRMNPVYLDILRKYHGYAFSWASIYTFWYHPMESTWGHVLGFAYTYFLMVQGSLMFTNVHKSKVFIFFLETFVIIHSGVVAAQTGGNEMLGTRLWPMFVFGFSLLLVTNQIFGFMSFWRRLPSVVRVIPLICYLAIIIGNYSWIPDDRGRTWIRMNEVIRIPLIEILYALFSMFLLFIVTRLHILVQNVFIQEKEQKGSEPTGIISRIVLSKITRGIAIISSFLIYVVMMAIGVILEVTSVTSRVNLFLMMLPLVTMYTIGSIISFMLMAYGFKHIVHLPRPKKIKNTQVHSENESAIELKSKPEIRVEQDLHDDKDENANIPNDTASQHSN